MAEDFSPEPEIHPLLPRTPGGGIRSSTAKQPDITLELEGLDADLEEANEEDKALFADNKRRGTSLILNDASLMILQVFQLFAVLQSLALRWPFPIEWVRGSYFIFIINFDIWNFIKAHSNVTYKEVQGYETPSALMPISYWHIMLAWGIFIFIGMSVFITCYLIITHRRHPFMMIRISNMQRIYVIICQIICLPVGIVIARLFHCTSNGMMDVDNTVKCYQPGLHLAYICPSLAFVFGLYGFLPAWMIIRTRAELLNLNSDKHEGYLQLKETEYVQGLDIIYVVSKFHLFASFKKFGCHFRSLFFIFALVILTVVSLTFRHIFYGAVIITGIFFILFVTVMIIRPYRVNCFNVLLSFSYFSLMLFSLMGALRSSFNSFSMASVWLTPMYLNIVLLVIAVAALASVLIFIVYLVVRHTGLCKRACPNPLWPSMTSNGLNKLSPETRKYVRSILRSRTLIEDTLSRPALFAPAHELSRQIQIINAFCRESEHLHDPIQDTLWDVLDELMEAHSQIAPRSLFAESVKDSIRQTATEFLKILPPFVRRLAQREYDFILVPPKKRRILFKMYCMGVFLNGRREKLEKNKLTLPSVYKVYRPGQEDEEFEQDDGYYEDMYPEPKVPMLVRSGTAVSMGVFSESGLDDEIVLQEAEEWTRTHPLSAGMTNRGFEDDVSAILHDDLSDMLDGIPSSSTAGSQISFIRDSPASIMFPRLVNFDTPESDRGSSLPIENTVSQGSLNRPSTASSERRPLSPAQEGSTASPRRGPDFSQRSDGPQITPPPIQPSSEGIARGLQNESEDNGPLEEWRRSPLPGQIEIINTPGETLTGEPSQNLASDVLGQSEA